jgi:hypothetical protein
MDVRLGEGGHDQPLTGVDDPDVAPGVRQDASVAAQNDAFQTIAISPGVLDHERADGR